MKTLLLNAITLFAGAACALAADGTWIDVTAGPSNWSDTTKWIGGTVADGSGFTANFTSDITATTTVTLDSNRTLGALVFSDAGASGSARQLSGGTLTLASGATPTINAVTATTIASNLAGTAGFTKTGNGALTLTGANTGLSGTVTLAAGSVYLTTADSLANTSINSTGGLLFLNNATATNFSVQSLTTNRDVFINNGSTLSIATGAVTFGANNFWIQTNAGATGFITSGTNTLTVTAASTTATSQAIRTIIKDNGVGAVSLVKAGAGTLIIDKTNTYTGNTVINGGTLSIEGGGGAVGAIRGTVTVNSGATLRLAADNATGYNTDGTRVDTIHLNGGTLNIGIAESAGNQTLGSTTINMTGAAITGVAGVGNAASNLDFFGGNSRINTLASSTTSTISGTKLSMRQSGGATFTVASGTTASGIDLDISSVIYNGNPLTKAGAGTMRLTGANTQNGIVLNAGRLITGNTSALGSGAVLVANGATLQVGDGSVNGVTLGAGSTLALNDGSTLKLGAAASQIAMTGAFTLGNGVKIDITGLNLATGTYTLISGTSGSSVLGTWNSGTDLLGGVAGSTYSLALSGTNLVLTAVPEPSTYGLLGAGALAAAAFVRRRRKAV